MRWISTLALCALVVCLLCGPVRALEPDRYWPHWRGPLASGEAPHGDPPLEWSESRNVRWKVEIPGRGHASPVVWGDHVFLLTAVDIEPRPQAVDADTPTWRRKVAPAGPVRFEVLAIDRGSGEIAWRRTAREQTPHEGTHPDGTWASASAVTDGEHLFAHFGSYGLYAYDLAGELQWSKDLGDMTTRRGFGEGSSPALAGDTLVVNWDHEGDSFIVALDKRTGEERWRRERDEITSWATPLVVEHGGRRQVVVNATGKVRGYDLATGETLWEEGGMTVNVIPTPVHDGGLVYVTSGFRGSALKALRLGGEDGATSLSWSYDRDTPYVPSPLLYRGQLYFTKVNSGILTSLDAATGEVRFGPERLPGMEGIYASPVAAAGRVYLVGRDGTTVVLRHGPQLEILAANTLDEGFEASPAIVDGELYLRGREHLYCIVSETESAAR